MISQPMKNKSKTEMFLIETYKDTNIYLNEFSGMFWFYGYPTKQVYDDLDMVHMALDAAEEAETI